VVIALLFGIAVLMTAIIYLAFTRLLRLPFSPGYAAFTFPMVIGATALFKMAHWMDSIGMAAQDVHQIHALAMVELLVATVVVSYVALRYVMYYQPAPRIMSNA
nr:C4-dicarboxylate ABC transporter [Vibrio vulnificus]